MHPEKFLRIGPGSLGATVVSHIRCRSASTASQLLQETFPIKFFYFPVPTPINLLQNLSGEQVLMYISYSGNCAALHYKDVPFAELVSVLPVINYIVVDSNQELIDVKSNR